MMKGNTNPSGQNNPATPIARREESRALPLTTDSSPHCSFRRWGYFSSLFALLADFGSPIRVYKYQFAIGMKWVQ